MRSIIHIVISFILLIPATGQDQWEVMHRGIYEVNCWGQISIDFIKSDTGWVYSREGIAKTIDGGFHWETMNRDMFFIDCKFRNDSLGWAICRDESEVFGIYNTRDGGSSWDYQKECSESATLVVVSDSTVYAFDVNSYKTTNGGSEWIFIGPFVGSGFNSACFLNADTGVVLKNSGDIFITFNGGAKWEDRTLPGLNVGYMKFLQDSTGYFLASDSFERYYVCKTTDFFNSWTVISETALPILNSHLFDNGDLISFVSDSTGIRIMKSYNFGSTWEERDRVETLVGLRTEFVFIDSNGYLSAHQGSNGFLMKSIDMGNHWTIQNLDFPLIQVHFIDTQRGIVSGGWGGFMHWGSMYGVFKTNNGGLTWKIISLVSGPGTNFTSCYFTTDSIGYLWGHRPALKTIDGGNEWLKLDDFSNIASMYFIDDNQGWVIGENDPGGCGTYLTKNGGTDWDLVNQGCESFNSVYFIDEETGWAVGEGGLIAELALNKVWNKTYLENGAPLNKVSFINRKTGWISGGYRSSDSFDPVFLRTVDGGENWTNITTTYLLINDFHFENENHGWAVGEENYGNGVILETFDGGLEWELVKETFTGPLHSLHFKDGYGWAVGDNGLILRKISSHTSNQDQSNIRFEDQFQNYPNPFHSRTVIRYQLPATSNVELNIFDLSGRKVSTLIKECQPAGTHETEWIANNFKPGIYFCELKSGQGRQVIKMILID